MANGVSDSRFFTADTLRFLRELGNHNNRPWFEENKGRYQASIQQPALRFIEAVAPLIGKLSPHLVADARPFGGSLLRIYRDTRFSKDKSPYKTNVALHFFYDRGADRVGLPGFLFHIAPGESVVHSGIYHPEPALLRKIRDQIVASPNSWARVLRGNLEIGGDSYVRPPAGYDPGHRYADDLRRKDFYASVHISDATITGPHLDVAFGKACRRLDPLNRFLAGVIGIPW